MKQRRKKYSAFLLASILTLSTAGCAKPGSASKDSPQNGTPQSLEQQSGLQKEEETDTGGEAENTASAKGRYIETEVSTPQNFSGKGNIRRLADQSLLLLDVNNSTINISSDNGKSWDTKPVHELEELWNGILEITGTALAEDGGVFISYATAEMKEDGTSPGKYLYFSIHNPEETMQKFELDIGNVEYLNDSAFTADGRLFAISTLQNVYEIDLDKKSCRQLFTVESGSDGAICTDGEMVIAADGTKAYFYDLKTGETEDEDQVLNTYIAKQRQKSLGIALYAANNGKDKQTLYVAGCNGIAGHVAGGSVMEQLVDGEISGLGDPSNPPVELIQNEDGSFLVLFQNGELDVYEYDKNAPAVPEIQLEIYGLYDNETIRKAVSVFRKKNPDVFVRFETGLSGGNGMTRDDAVKNLNTKLLAKEGPDLILLDDMPLDSYQEKGMLVDLSGLAGDLTSSGNYFEGILNGFGTAEGTYALPFRYQVPLLAGESQILSEISDLKTLADAAEILADQPATQETVLGSYTPEEVLEKLYLTSANVWINEKGEADPALLQEFLTQAKRIYDADQKNLDAEELDAHREYVEHIRHAYKDEERKVSNVLYGIERVFDTLRGNQVLTAGELTDMYDFQFLMAVKKELAKHNKEMGYQILKGQDEQLFSPTGTIGVSVNSGQKELAEEFIRVLLGMDVQKCEFEDGFPVNADAYEAFTTNPTPGKTMATGDEDKEGNPFILSIRWPDEQELEQLKTILESLKTPAVFDENLKNEVITIGAQALKGDREIEESAEEIAQKISLHLNE